MAWSFGPSAKVRMAETSSAIEVIDLDDMATKKEIANSVLAIEDLSDAKVISLRKAYGGTQTAIVLLNAQAAKRL